MLEYQHTVAYQRCLHGACYRNKLHGVEDTKPIQFTRCPSQDCGSTNKSNLKAETWWKVCLACSSDSHRRSRWSLLSACLLCVTFTYWVLTINSSRLSWVKLSYLRRLKRLFSRQIRCSLGQPMIFGNVVNLLLVNFSSTRLLMLRKAFWSIVCMWFLPRYKRSIVPIPAKFTLVKCHVSRVQRKEI